MKDFAKNLMQIETCFLLMLIALFAVGNIFAQGDGYSGEAIWYYDSDLNVKHVETFDITDDGVEDVIAAEYSNDYYGNISLVIAINGKTGVYEWTYQIDDGIRSMVIGDLNNDGIPDIIAGASYNSGNTPDGRVHAIDGSDGSQLWTFDIGSTINAVTIGDFNGDEYLDVAAGCFDDYIYGIDGQTGTQLWSRNIGSLWINALDAADINGDGIDDVAYAHEYLAGYDNFLGVLDGNNGIQIWEQTVPYILLDVMFEDIDNDAQLELVVATVYSDDHGEIQVLTAADGGLEWDFDLGTLNHSNGDISLFAHDIDEDGDLDLVLCTYIGTRQIFAFNGDAAATMWVSDALDNSSTDLAFADVTGDKNLNIVAASGDRFVVLDAADGSEEYYYSVAGNIKSVSCADFNEDEIIDIAAGGGADFVGFPPDPGKTVWAIKTIQSPLLWEFQFGEYGNGLALGDFNGDNCDDALAVNSIPDNATAIDGLLGELLWQWVGTDNLYAATAGDFDNDGYDDGAVAGADDMITALSGSDGGIMWQFTTPTDQIYRSCLKSADLNDDINIDVIAGTDDNNVYAIDGKNGVQLWATNVGGEVSQIQLAQMDGIGPVDIIAAVGGGPSGEKVAVLSGSDGSLLWEYQAGEAVAFVEVLDANEDGAPDVAAAITPFGTKRVLLIDGVSHLEVWSVPLPIPSNISGMGSGDLNDDKIPDILVPGNSSDQKVYALSGDNGSILWSFQTGGEVNCALVYDVDGDEIGEAVIGSDDQNVYVIDGPTGVLDWNYSTAGDVMSIQIGDLNCNNRPNIVCVTFDSDGIAYAFRSLAPELPDGDDDGIPDEDDNCPVVANPGQEDGDEDGVGDLCDNCEFVANPDQADSDDDGIGDACDYVCGDANGDGGVNLADASFIVNYIFYDGPTPDPIEAGDANGDGGLNMADAGYIINYIFYDGPDPVCP